MVNKPPASIDLSVIITAHAEGILIHHTIASVNRAINYLGEGYSSEIILHIDNPTNSTTSYVENHKSTVLKNVIIFNNSFGDLGMSRNYAIKQAHGKYIATIDADDIMSANWLRSSLEHLERQLEVTVAHSEVTVEFEGADSLIIKHGGINTETDALLSVYANRWNSVIVAPRDLLLEEQYAPNSPGYGYEDWHLNCRLIARGIHNILIPETAIFARRRKSNSEWQRQIKSMSVLHANPLLEFNFIRNIQRPSSPIDFRQKDEFYAKKIIKHYPLVHGAAKSIKRLFKYKKISPKKHSTIPLWLKNEWRNLHEIDRQIFPSDQLLSRVSGYDTITLEHIMAGGLYKTIIDSLKHDSYDYLIFVPWLIKGGADQYAINYANTIASLKPDKRVVVIATLPVDSIWKNKLDSNVDFIDFGIITSNAPAEIKHRLMEHLIENANITHIHIINSEFGYDFVNLHNHYVKSTDKKIIVTSFSQSVDKDGRLYGYSHTHVPVVYDYTSYITSDNQAVIDMWQREYGFDEDKMAVHRQPVTISADSLPHHEQHSPLRILWASRIAREKMPELIPRIGSLLRGSAIIDMYGTIEDGNELSIHSLPDNVFYKGDFDGFESIPINKYDVFLYTSMFDGMPNIVLDAARLRIPIIASAVGGIPEFIINKKTGLLINDYSNPQAYTNAITNLINNPNLGKELCQNALSKLINDFSPSKYKDQVEKMLKKIGY
jgi:glycosyltransferase involved in cell wall biosynthesis